MTLTVLKLCSVPESLDSHILEANLSEILTVNC